MDSAVGGTGGGTGKRVFVLVDRDEARGCFLTWDGAEVFADENHFALDNLYEYETSAEFPDHLFLMSGLWGGAWRFIGQWKRTPPKWSMPPEQIRLEHYRLRTDAFELFRQKTFDWEDGLLQRIDPMAPEPDTRKIAQQKPSTQPIGWKPKVAPLKPVQPIQTPKVERIQPRVLPKEPSPEAEPAAAKPPETASEPPNAPPRKPKLALKRESTLRLKNRKPPMKPIPDFKPATQAVHDLSGKPQEPAPGRKAAPKKEAVKPKPRRRLMRLSLMAPLITLSLFWTGGIWWALRPPELASEIVVQISSLSNARLTTIEPGQVVFQLRIQPVEQHRWVHSLDLEVIPSGETIPFPHHIVVETWAKPDGFIRPPFAVEEVEEWWKLRKRIIEHGYYHRWKDGSIIVLDLEGDMLLGWARAKQLTQIMN